MTVWRIAAAGLQTELSADAGRRVRALGWFEALSFCGLREQPVAVRRASFIDAGMQEVIERIDAGRRDIGTGRQVPGGIEGAGRIASFVRAGAYGVLERVD